MSGNVVEDFDEWLKAGGFVELPPDQPKQLEPQRRARPVKQKDRSVEADAYRVKISVKNNLLLSAIEAAGYTGHGSISRFCDDAGVCKTAFSALVNLRIPPITNDGEFSQAAKAIMEFLGAAPTDLWSPEQMTMKLGSASAWFSMSSEAVADALGWQHSIAHLDAPDEAANKNQLSRLVCDALATLSPREQKVIRHRFGIGTSEKTLEEVAVIFDVGRERVRQIESAALRKLKHPSRSRELAKAAVAEGGTEAKLQSVAQWVD